MTAPSSGATHPIEPVTIDRAAAILDEQQLDYQRSGSAIRTGFYDAAIGIVENNNSILMDARWRGEPEPSLRENLLQAAHEWNLMQLQPTMYVDERNEQLSVHVQRALPALPDAGGYTHNQLGYFMVSFITATATACEYLAHSFPDLVTWERPIMPDGDAPSARKDNDAEFNREETTNDSTESEKSEGE